MGYIPRLKQEYKERVMAALTEEFGYKNVMEIPKLQKIVLSRGVGGAVADKKLIDYALDELLDEDQQEEIHDYFLDAESDSIEDALEEFEGDYDDEELRLYRIKFTSEVAN